MVFGRKKENKLVIEPFKKAKVTLEGVRYHFCKDMEYYFSVVLNPKHKGNRDHNNGVFIYYNGKLLGLLKRMGERVLLSFSCESNPILEMNELEIYALEKKAFNKLIERYLVAGVLKEANGKKEWTNDDDIVKPIHRMLKVNFTGRLVLHHSIKPYSKDTPRSYDPKRTIEKYEEETALRFRDPDHNILETDEMKRQRDVLIGYLKDQRKKAGKDELFFDYIIEL